MRGRGRSICRRSAAFDLLRPAPFWHAARDGAYRHGCVSVACDHAAPMVMYHSGIRRTPVCARSLPRTPLREHGDGRAVHVSPTANGRGWNPRMAGCAVAYPHDGGRRASTVWTWNAIASKAAPGALRRMARRPRPGPADHLISEHLPSHARDDGRRLTNSNPVTGQAAWYDVRVRLTRARRRRMQPAEFVPLTGAPRGLNTSRWSAGASFHEARSSHRSHLVSVASVCDRLQAVERCSAISGPLADTDAYGAEPSAPVQPHRHFEVGEYPSSKTINFPMSCLHCEEAACVTCGPPAHRTSARTAICGRTRTAAWDATFAPGPAPTAHASRMRTAHGEKCTLCVDRVMTNGCRKKAATACVPRLPDACAPLRYFEDPESNVSKLTAARGGFSLLDELGYSRQSLSAARVPPQIDVTRPP